MENNKNLGALVESEDIINYFEVKKFENNIKGANLTQLNEEAKNIKNRQALLQSQIEKCNTKLFKLDEEKRQEQTFVNENKFKTLLTGGIGGTAVALGLGLYENFANIANTTQIQALQQIVCISSGVLAGYVFYKLAKENKDEMAQNTAIQKINASKTEVNKEKSVLSDKLEIENIKAGIVSGMASSKALTSLK